MIASDIISVIGHFRDTGEMERFATEWIEFAKSVNPSRDEIALRFAVALFSNSETSVDVYKPTHVAEAMKIPFTLADAFIAARDAGAK